MKLFHFSAILANDLSASRLIKPRPSSFNDLFLAVFSCLFLVACLPAESDPIITEARYYHQVDSEKLLQLDGYSVMRKFSGTVKSKQISELNFEVMGKVEHIYADEGDLVVKGQLLASLNTQLLLIEQQNLQAQVQEVNAQMLLVEENLKRITALINNGYASTQNLDELTVQKQILAANKQQLAASLDAKKYQIEHAKIYAPFAGTINQRFIDIGEFINNSEVVFELQQQQINEFKVGIPQHLVAQVRKQKSFNLFINEQT